jgi:type I restriction enzyme, R subunit
MPAARLTESVVEEAAIVWLASLGYSVLHGPDIAVGHRAPRHDVGLEGRVREALGRLNANLSSEALGDALRCLPKSHAGRCAVAGVA